jgi:hypothetical protein
VGQLFTQSFTNQTTSWLVCGWSTFGARMNHMHTQIHKTHHGLDLGGATTFLFIIIIVISHGGYIQMSFYPGILKLGVSKFSKLGFLTFRWAIPSCVDLRLKLGLKENCSPCRRFFNDMLHAACMQINMGDS